MTVRTARRPILGAAALVVAGAAALIPAAAHAQSQAPGPAPTPTTAPPVVYVPVSVSSVEVVHTATGTALVVKGVKPGAAVALHLEAAAANGPQPDYWRYSVVGCAPGTAANTPYTQTFAYPAAPVGGLGVVIGSFAVDLGGRSVHIV